MLISIIDLVWPHTFSTVLEVYYGTPYDRHVILEESSDVRYRKPRNTRNGGLEDPPGLGSRILRRLSSKARDMQGTTLRRSSPAGVSSSAVENKAFQGDVPQSPWHYPFRRSQQLPHMQHPHTLQHHQHQHQQLQQQPPHHHQQQLQFVGGAGPVVTHPMHHMQRTLSQDSGSSIASAAVQISPLHKHTLARMLP